MKYSQIDIIGGGCAAFSLARLIKKTPLNNINLFLGKSFDLNKDHFWGFWKNKFNEDAYKNADHIWYKWSIYTENSNIILSSKTHPYCAIKKKKWLSFCQSELKTIKVNYVKENVIESDNALFVNDKEINSELVFDSRPPEIPSNIMLQHFQGYVVEANKDVFDDTTAILMDFRCDQSRGIHFIYLLPFSKKKALVESTMFSKKIQNKSFYKNEISKYLKKYFDLTSFTISHHEEGVIPMHEISIKSQYSFSIGTRGGAVRPSSGYAFTFIQKQVFQIFNQIRKDSFINTKIHNNLDLFLDKVFICVIDKYPQLAPKIFSSLASKLNGDEMAQFMSGECSKLTIFKVIFAMPKLPFIKSFMLMLVSNARN